MKILVFDERCSFGPLETDLDFHVTRAGLELFEPLIERFLVNGKTVVISFPSRDCQK